MCQRVEELYIWNQSNISFINNSNQQQHKIRNKARTKTCYFTMTGSGREQSFSGEFEKWASRELEASKLPVNAVSDFCTRACKKKTKTRETVEPGSPF